MFYQMCYIQADGFLVILELKMHVPRVGKSVFLGFVILCRCWGLSLVDSAAEPH